MYTKIAAAILLALSLQGCWFVFIPGSLIKSVSDGMSQPATDPHKP